MITKLITSAQHGDLPMGEGLCQLLARIEILRPNPQRVE